MSAEIRLNAKRRIGEISNKLGKAKANQYSAQFPNGGKKQDVLKAADISTSEANGCEKLGQSTIDGMSRPWATGKYRSFPNLGIVESQSRHCTGVSSYRQVTGAHALHQKPD